MVRFLCRGRVIKKLDIIEDIIVDKIYKERFGTCFFCRLLVTNWEETRTFRATMDFGQFGYIQAADGTDDRAQYAWDFNRDEIFIKFMSSKYPEYIDEYIRGYKSHVLENYANNSDSLKPECVDEMKRGEQRIREIAKSGNFSSANKTTEF